MSSFKIRHSEKAKPDSIITVSSGNTARVFVGKEKAGRFRPVRCAWDRYPPSDVDMDEMKAELRTQGILKNEADFLDFQCDEIPSDAEAYRIAQALHRAEKARNN